MKRGKEYHGCEEEYNVEKKGKEKQCHLPYNTKAVVRISSWEGRGRNLEEKYHVVGILYTPEIFYFKENPMEVVPRRQPAPTRAQ